VNPPNNEVPQKRLPVCWKCTGPELLGIRRVRPLDGIRSPRYWISQRDPRSVAIGTLSRWRLTTHISVRPTATTRSAFGCAPQGLRFRWHWWEPTRSPSLTVSRTGGTRQNPIAYDDSYWMSGGAGYLGGASFHSPQSSTGVDLRKDRREVRRWLRNRRFVRSPEVPRLPWQRPTRLEV
jgi:hypothetical protein